MVVLTRGTGRGPPAGPALRPDSALTNQIAACWTTGAGSGPVRFAETSECSSIPSGTLTGGGDSAPWAATEAAADQRHKIALTPDLDPQDAEAGLLAVEGDALDRAGEAFVRGGGGGDHRRIVAPESEVRVGTAMWCEVRDPQAEPSRRDEIGLTVLSLDVGGIRYILFAAAEASRLDD